MKGGYGIPRVSRRRHRESAEGAELRRWRLRSRPSTPLEIAPAASVHNSMSGAMSYVYLVRPRITGLRDKSHFRALRIVPAVRGSCRCCSEEGRSTLSPKKKMSIGSISCPPFFETAHRPLRSCNHEALVYKGPGQKSWEDVADPVIQKPTDVIVKMIATAICGTDLHILKGDVPEVEVGRILGHEGIGVITEIGAGVTQLAVGDKVILSCVSSCGRCSNCREGLFGHCLDPEGIAGIGWIFGYMIDGTQAELVRVPFAENSVYKMPESLSESEGILLSDILPTGFEIGVQYGDVNPGDVVGHWL